MQENHQIIDTLTSKWVLHKMQVRPSDHWHPHTEMGATEKMQEIHQTIDTLTFKWVQRKTAYKPPDTRHTRI